MKDVIAGLKETVKKAMGTRICYTSVDLLLRRCTRKLLDENRRRILGTAEKPIELISIDDDKNGIANVLCDDYTFEADILEEGVLAKFKKQIISERKRYILDGLVAGYSQHDIAQSLGISDSAVSQAVKDIRKRLQSYKD